MPGPGVGADAMPVRPSLGAPRPASPFWSFSSSSCWWGWSPRWHFPNWSGSRGPSRARPSATTSWISSRVSGGTRCCKGGPTWSSDPTTRRAPVSPALRGGGGGGGGRGRHGAGSPHPAARRVGALFPRLPWPDFSVTPAFPTYRTAGTRPGGRSAGGRAD